jgi:hypothetical protein
MAASAALYLQEEVQSGSPSAPNQRFQPLPGGAQLLAVHLAREAEISRKRAEIHVGILEDRLLGFGLPVFQRRAQRQLVQQQTFFFFDAGCSARCGRGARWTHLKRSKGLRWKAW